MKTRELNKEEMSILMNLQQADKENVIQLYDAMKEETHVLEAIDKRSKALGYTLDQKAQIMILTYADGVIGHAAGYVDHISVWASNHKKELVSFEDVNMRIFPNGVIDFKS